MPPDPLGITGLTVRHGAVLGLLRPDAGPVRVPSRVPADAGRPLTAVAG
ncbi:hypothetical protein [Geodermatophilus sp. SYSU D01176]